MSKHSASDDAFTSLLNRLVTAVLAPIFFNLSLLIIWAMFFRKTHFFQDCSATAFPCPARKCCG